jgi:hypothetical protein
MTNIFTTAETDLIKAGSFLLGVADKAKAVLTAEKAVAPEAAAAAVKLFTSVEALISLAAPAAGANGLNFAADSAAYAQFLQIVADAKEFAAASDAVLKTAAAAV